MSARGGTTGRACGCPARFGLAGGRSGCDGEEGALGAPGRIVCGRRGDGMLGRLGAEGRGAGVPKLGLPKLIGGAFGASPTPAGSGCLGPDKICPGLGGGTGRAGIAEPRATWPGAAGVAGAGIEGAAGAAGACATCGMAGAAGAGGTTRGGAACGNGIDGGEKCPVDKGGRRGGARRTGGAGTSSAIFASGSFVPCSATGASVFGVAGFTAGCARTGSGADSS